MKSLADNPFQAFIKPLRGRIVHIHAADSDGVYIPGTSSVSEGKPLGEGDLDLDGFATSLKQIGASSLGERSIMIVLEPKETDFGKPLNALRSLIKLDDLLKTKINIKTGKATRHAEGPRT
jgi:sugar phosphate isomerase/epimerase